MPCVGEPCQIRCLLVQYRLLAFSPLPPPPPGSATAARRERALFDDEEEDSSQITMLSFPLLPSASLSIHSSRPENRFGKTSATYKIPARSSLTIELFSDDGVGSSRLKAALARVARIDGSWLSPESFSNTRRL